MATTFKRLGTKSLTGEVATPTIVYTAVASGKIHKVTKIMIAVKETELVYGSDINIFHVANSGSADDTNYSNAIARFNTNADGTLGDNSTARYLNKEIASDIILEAGEALYVEINNGGTGLTKGAMTVYGVEVDT